jgi:hypothetical protein
VKYFLIVLGILAIGGIAFGLAAFGVFKVPGISPYDYGKPKLATSSDAGGFLWTLMQPVNTLAREAERAKPAAPTGSAGASPTLKPRNDLGDEKVATLWNELDVDKLALITVKWNAEDLAHILLKMDPDQVSKYLAAVDTKRAVLLSQAIRKLASEPPPVVVDGS